MLPEISLNILDIAENSTRAGASFVEITVSADTRHDRLTVTVADNGSGMSEEVLAQVTDPFYTSRTTRKVGLGVPFFKFAAECTGGHFSIRSREGEGTVTEAVFVLSHIDRMPLGDVNETIRTLISGHPDTDFLYRYQYDDREFTLDTRAFKEILGGISLDVPEVSAYIKEYLEEGKNETDGGAVY